MRRKFWLENLKGRDDSEDIEIDGSMMLDWILGVSVRHQSRRYKESCFLCDGLHKHV